jgi:hypothetical protein
MGGCSSSDPNPDSLIEKLNLRFAESQPIRMISRHVFEHAGHTTRRASMYGMAIYIEEFAVFAKTPWHANP